jgi:hypothetical protein
MRYVFSILVLLLIAVAPVVAQQCPSVTIDGPTKVEANVDLKLQAKVEHAPTTSGLLYRWTTSVGTIKSGINTSEIQLDIAGLGGVTLEITLETFLLDNSCKSTTKHTVEVELPPPACGMAYDMYGDIRWEDEQARLDNFAIQIQNVTSARGLLTSFAGKRTYKDEASLRLLRAKNYLVGVRGIDPARIVTIDAGYKDDFTMMLHVVPEKATIPDFSYDSTVPKNKVKFTKRRPKNISGKP